jgi:preprotein translocase subunit YajC
MSWGEPLELIRAQAGPPLGPLGPMGQMLPLVLILVVFYFLLVRPQQQKAKEHNEVVAGLKKNDQVVTIAGIYGRIVDVGDAYVTLEIAPNVIVRHERSQIGAVVSGKDTKAVKNQGRAGS